MNVRDFLPAMCLCLLATGTLAGVKLFPIGTGFVVVKLRPATLAHVLGAASLADVTLIGMPAPGFAVLHGNAGRIRAVTGLAVAWDQISLCSFGS